MPSLPARLLARRALAAPRIPPRAFHHASRSLAPPEPSLVPPPTALSALASRLSLRPSPALQSALVTCLTHPSFVPAAQQDSELQAGPGSAAPATKETNELLATLGNSLLGLFASEHLSTIYPYLPTKPLQQAVTAYVGPASCLSVARSLGVAVQGGGNTGLPGLGAGSSSAGVAVRWSKTAVAERNWRDTRGEAAQGPLKVPVGKRFRKYIKQEDQDVTVQARRETHEDVVASAVRAFVGLIYQEQASLMIHNHVSASCANFPFFGRVSMPREHSPTPTSFPELLTFLLSSPPSILCKCSPLLSPPTCPLPASPLPPLTPSSNHAYSLPLVPLPKRPCSSLAYSCLQVSSSPRDTGQVKPWLNIGRL